jgi:ABC-type nickel/cobalt efflux system permease component RcnA
MPLTVFIRREVISRIVLIIMAVAVLSSSLMVKPQAAYNIQETTTVSEHQHDSDEPLNEHDPLLFHSHGSVHHLNADHSHDLNKLFALTALHAWNPGMRVMFALSSEQILQMPQTTPNALRESFLRNNFC